MQWAWFLEARKDETKTSSDLHRMTVPRSSSAGSWTGSDSPAQSPTQSQSASGGLQYHIDFLQTPIKMSEDSMLSPVIGGVVMGGAAGSSEVQFVVGANDGGDADDEYGEDGFDMKSLTKKDIHTLNEQRRRDIIKQGYAQLVNLVPTCKPSPTGAKVSRAALLQKTIDYVIFLQNQSVKQEEQLESLEKEVKALMIMKENYEHIARAQQHTTSSDMPQVPDHVKFLVFQSIADQLFQTFNSSISVTSFDTLSACIISWLEEYCKPQSLRELVIGNLQRVNALNSPGMSYPTIQTHPSMHGAQQTP